MCGRASKNYGVGGRGGGCRGEFASRTGGGKGAVPGTGGRETVKARLANTQDNQKDFHTKYPLEII